MFFVDKLLRLPPFFNIFGFRLPAAVSACKNDEVCGSESNNKSNSKSTKTLLKLQNSE